MTFNSRLTAILLTLSLAVGNARANVYTLAW